MPSVCMLELLNECVRVQAPRLAQALEGGHHARVHTLEPTGKSHMSIVSCHYSHYDKWQ